MTAIHLDLDPEDMPDSELRYGLRRAAAIRQDAAFVKALIAIHPERFVERPCDTEEPA